MLTVGQGLHRDIGDVALVDERPGRLAVGPADHAAGADLVRPRQRVGGETTGPQERPFRRRVLDGLLDLAPHAVFLRRSPVVNGHRRQVDNAADLAGDGIHGRLRAPGREEGPEQEGCIGAGGRVPQRVRVGQVAVHSGDAGRQPG